ncbi:MAG: hypothetical protein C0605_10775 [Hyphomicrobiales bacterium]|nr:MAG: hypothetical protein C0605_10775 [Hyphomicrobiales bacterium]
MRLNIKQELTLFALFLKTTRNMCKGWLKRKYFLAEAGSSISSFGDMAVEQMRIYDNISNWFVQCRICSYIVLAFRK